MGVAGEKGVGRGVSVVRKGSVSVKIKRQEPPNGGFGQGTVVCCRIHGGNAKARKYLSGPRCQGFFEKFFEKFLQRFSWGTPSRSGVFENQDAAIIERDFGSFQIVDCGLWIVDLKRTKGG